VSAEQSKLAVETLLFVCLHWLYHTPQPVHSSPGYPFIMSLTSASLKKMKVRERNCAMLAWIRSEHLKHHPSLSDHHHACPPSASAHALRR
jgi:hypothetical protein